MSASIKQVCYKLLPPKSKKTIPKRLKTKWDKLLPKLKLDKKVKKYKKRNFKNIVVCEDVENRNDQKSLFEKYIYNTFERNCSQMIENKRIEMINIFYIRIMQYGHMYINQFMLQGENEFAQYKMVLFKEYKRVYNNDLYKYFLIEIKKYKTFTEFRNKYKFNNNNKNTNTLIQNLPRSFMQLQKSLSNNNRMEINNNGKISKVMEVIEKKLKKLDFKYFAQNPDILEKLEIKSKEFTRTQLRVFDKLTPNVLSKADLLIMNTHGEVFEVPRTTRLKTFNLPQNIIYVRVKTNELVTAHQDLWTALAEFVLHIQTRPLNMKEKLIFLINKLNNLYSQEFNVYLPGMIVEDVNLSTYPVNSNFFNPHMRLIKKQSKGHKTRIIDLDNTYLENEKGVYQHKQWTNGLHLSKLLKNPENIHILGVNRKQRPRISGKMNNINQHKNLLNLYTNHLDLDFTKKPTIIINWSCHACEGKGKVERDVPHLGKGLISFIKDNL